MRTYTTIGANYKTTAKYINDPVSEYYVPDASAQMNCDQLMANQDKLEAQLEEWRGIYDSQTHKAKLNLDKIIRAQEGKLNAYKSLTAACQTQAEPKGMAVEPGIKNEMAPEAAAEAPAQKMSYLPLLIGGAALLFILTKRK
jgi:hypothetical protein